jgi:hypothetical protein
MFSVGVSALTALVVWSLAALALTWGRLPGARRRALALVTSALGLVMLMVALSAQGQREALTTGQFLLGGAYVTGHASASASLRYYVITAVCLLLGTVGLALPDDAARRLDRHPVALAVALSLFVTALRFALEKVAAPETWAYAVGIIWLAPVVGAVFFLRAREEGKGWRAVMSGLLRYAVAARGAVALLMVAATAFRLGSHYDLSAVKHLRVGSDEYWFAPGGPRQILYLGVIPQVTFWVAYTLVAGLLGASLVAGAFWLRRGKRMGAASPEQPANESRELSA